MSEIQSDNYDYFGELNVEDVYNLSYESGFSYEVLAEKCISGDYILIVGPDVMLRENVFEGSSEHYMKRLLEKMNKSVTHRDICESLAYVEHIHKLDETVKNDIEPSLKKLLETRCFNTIITTDCTPFLEKILKQLWGKDQNTGKNNFTVCNIYGDSINTKVDISREDIKPNEFNEIRPILYYAFGKAEYENLSRNGDIRRFSITDDDKIRIVTKWIGADGPVNFRHHIGQKRILAVGCRFDDWLFRFFWHMLRTEYIPNRTFEEKRKDNFVNETEGQNVLRGEVAFDYTPEESLENYLKGKSVDVFKDDARDFIDKLVKAIEKQKESIEENMKKWKDLQLDNLIAGKGIFISYAHEDFWIVRRIYEQLTAKYNVWMDVRLEAGDKYDERIENAIKQCGVFMPILSPTTIKCLKKDNVDRYFYDIEWKEAESRAKSESNLNGGFKVLPVLLDSVDLEDKTLREKLPDFILDKDIYEIAKEKIQVLTSKLDEMLNLSE